MSENQENTAHQNDLATDKRQDRGHPFRYMVIVFAVVVGVALIGKWLYYRHTHVQSEDAEVASNEITVSSRLAGRVMQFAQRRGNLLHEGEVLAKLDDQPAKLKLAQLQGKLAAMKSRLIYEQKSEQVARDQRQGGIRQAEAEMQGDLDRVKQARADRDKIEHTYNRDLRLFQAHQLSAQKKDDDYYSYQSAQAAVAEAKQQIAVDKVALANAHLGVLSNPMMLLPSPDLLGAKQTVTHQQVVEAEADVARQRNQIHDLTVRAPQDGVVDETFIQPGEYITPGQPILMMHQPSDVWIRAKIKETKVSQLHVGQKVVINVDAYPNQTFNGHVEVIGQAATNQFALLPDPNPSGNFTKITQRVPVRIEIDKGPKAQLAPGMMVEVAIAISQDK
jgi:membrane fusion protein (multidrug efflux system)